MMLFGTLLLWFSLSLGLQEYTELYNTDIYNHAPIYTEIELHAENEWLDLYTVCQNEMEIDTDSIYLLSVQAYYTVGATISIGNFSFDVSHMCQHPEANAQIDLTGEYGGNTKIEITFSSKE